MKKEEIPQDNGALGKIAKEVTYVVDENGNYSTGQSTGWDVKTEALNVAWHDVEAKIEAAKQQVLSGGASPILYFMEKKIMDLNILASYTGYWKWTIKKHLKPSGFQKLPADKLKKYAALFEVSVEELKNPFNTVNRE
ncbi:hypothetical protein [Niabella drilacis]|uniref:HTH cro/C1-type domain-containing protein n=1 Tax=Niabella drilacis (strain DSM 25811 / CCM 8410 / CCUG 62505 / LMG 26954 / E90) TaxID=1285928 RepID=A0A1G6NJ21_NIADE|nr:hypothetical protein [Niabella drilacis]SDC67778.1 hypothetical protein SAMN04487894_103291 [Niabella drilacis]